MAQRKNPHTVRYGNENGEIRFGHIHDDNELSGFLVRTGDDGGRHYMTMDSTGNIEGGRRGSTTNVCPGTYTIKAGRTVDDKVPAIFQYAENGDILIGSPKGRIRIWAQNIEIKADGTGGQNGVVNINANEKIIIDSKGDVDISAVRNHKIFSEKTVDIIGRSILNLYGGLIDFADGATKGKRAKDCGSGPSINEERNQ